MKKRLFATLLALVMALGLTATAWADDPVTYLKADNTTGTCETYTTVTSETPTSWGDGWYVVNSNVTINDKVTITGNVNLILCDGMTLTVQPNDPGKINVNGIRVESGHSLTIYGQICGTGLLSVTSADDAPGICNLGTLIINGGTVTATGTGNSNGIYNNDGSTLTINDGVVMATGHGSDAGIYSYSNGLLTINGGEVTATGRGNRSGIEGNVTITGGTVKAAATGMGKAVDLKDGNLTLPTTYWWRTAECGDFTASTATTYAPGAEKYAEFTTQTNPVNENAHTYGDWVEGTPATCTENGTKGHKDCSVCNKHFDANGVEITDLTIPAGHTLTRVPAKDATRQETGNIEYWQCSGCNKYFADAAAEKEIDQADTVIAKLPPKKNNSTTAATTTETVASPKTTDPGVLISGALSVVSLLGMGYVRKKL